MDTDNTQIELNIALRKLQEMAKAGQENANALLGLQLSNAQKLYNAQQEYLNREKKERLEAERKAAEEAARKAAEKKHNLIVRSADCRRGGRLIYWR